LNSNSATKLIAILVLTLSIAAFPYGPRVHTVRGDLSPIDTTAGTQWVPSGPAEDKILISVFSDEIAEFNALQAGTLDFTDWPLTKPLVAGLSTDSRFAVTSPNSELGEFELQFNHAVTFFGIPFNFGSDSDPVAAAKAQNFRQGVAHLIDKQTFVSNVLGGLATAIDNFLPPGEGVLHTGLECGANSPAAGCTAPYTSGGYSLVGACNWDQLNGVTTAGQTHDSTCLSAYHTFSDTTDSVGIVSASASNHDFCEAAEHWVAAGLASGISSTDCHLTGLSTALSGGSILFDVRVDSPPRLKLGDALAARMCELINGAGVTTCTQISINHLTITAATGQVFKPCSSGSCGSPNTGWAMYTAGYGFSTAAFDQTEAIYNGQFAGGPWTVGTTVVCTNPDGTPALATNTGSGYQHFCNAAHDHYTDMVEFNNTLAGAAASLQKSNEIFGKKVASIPLWSGANQFATLKGWNNVVNAKGFGPAVFGNAYSLYNTWNPSPATSGTIRWGFKQGTSTLNPYTLSTVWEANAVSTIFDPLLQFDPYQGSNQLYGWLVNSFKSVLPSDAVDGPTCTNGVAGQTAGTVSGSKLCLKFSLRNDVFWHDGQQLKSSDVKYTFLSLQQIGSPLTTALIDVSILSDQNFMVHLNQLGPFQLLNFGLVGILPQHIWASTTTSPCVLKGSLQCTLNKSFLTGGGVDPVSTHMLIGTGGFVCKDLSTGAIGGGCTSTGSSTTGPGATIVLQRNGLGSPGLTPTDYFRSNAKYKVFLWADGVPLATNGEGTVDIGDAGQAGTCFNLSPSTNPQCAHLDAPATIVSCTSVAGSCGDANGPLAGGPGTGALVGINEIAQIFARFGYVWNAAQGGFPAVFAYNSFQGAQPIPQTLYAGGNTYGPTTPPGPDFTVSISPNINDMSVGTTGVVSTVTITPLNGFSDSISVAVSANPTGLTVTPSTTTVPLGTLTFTLTVDTTTALLNGAYATTVTLTSSAATGSKVHVATIVTSAGQYSVSATAVPAFSRGTAASSTLSITAINGFTSKVKISTLTNPTVTGGPDTSCPVTLVPLCTVSLSTGSGMQTLSIITSGTTPIGSYTIKVSIQSGSAVVQVSIPITVNGP
jgi:ABC-type transport system substrate-binding protein